MCSFRCGYPTGSLEGLLLACVITRRRDGLTLTWLAPTLGVKAFADTRCRTHFGALATRQPSLLIREAILFQVNNNGFCCRYGTFVLFVPPELCFSLFLLHPEQQKTPSCLLAPPFAPDVMHTTTGAYPPNATLLFVCGPMLRAPGRPHRRSRPR